MNKWDSSSLHSGWSSWCVLDCQQLLSNFQNLKRNIIGVQKRQILKFGICSTLKPLPTLWAWRHGGERICGEHCWIKSPPLTCGEVCRGSLLQALSLMYVPGSLRDCELPTYLPRGGETGPNWGRLAPLWLQKRSWVSVTHMVDCLRKSCSKGLEVVMQVSMTSFHIL